MTWFLGPIVRYQELWSKNTHVPTKFEKWPCSRKIWEVIMLQKIWEATMLQTMWKATMLHQKINMTVSLQWMEVFIFLNFHPPGNDLIFGPVCPLPRALLKKYPCFAKSWGHFSHFGGTRPYSFFDGAWSLLKCCGAWSFFKFCWNMRIFLSKALGCGQSGPKIKSLPGGWKFKKMNTSIYCRFLEPKKRVPP